MLRLFILLAHLTTYTAHANDTTATVAGNAITYDTTKDISMDSETLDISTSNIKVSYVFTNHASQDIETDVAFPLPLSPVFLGDTSLIYPSWDNLYTAQLILDEANRTKTFTALGRSEEVAFTDFKNTVDGQNSIYKPIVKAIGPEGKDITDLLIKNDIPLSATYLSGFMDEGAIHRDIKLRNKIEKLGLIDSTGKILWQLQITFVWKQSFPAKKSINVTHTYSPYTGFYYMIGTRPKSLDQITFHHRDTAPNGKVKVKNFNDFQINEAQKKAILELFTQDSEMYHMVKEVHYILTTGANWKGPIKKFSLNIIPPTSKTIVLCSLKNSLTKTSQGTYSLELTNFTPVQDLRILFIDPMQP